MDPKRYCQRVFDDLVQMDVDGEDMEMWFTAIRVMSHAFRLCAEGRGCVAVDIVVFVEEWWKLRVEGLELD